VTQLDLDALNRLLWYFGAHRVITVAARVGMLRRLAEGSSSVEGLSADLGLDSLATGKVVRALTALGLVTADLDGRYRVAEPLVPYFRSGSDDIAPFLEHHHGMYDSWGANLEPWLRGGEWQTRPRAPQDIARFGNAMRAVGTHAARRVVEQLDLSSTESMLDVGGGFGHYSQAFCRANPNLHATVLDIPPVAEMAASALADEDFADRIRFVGGDYLTTDYGSDYDLVLFANVLHQENRDHAAEMVGRGAQALAHGGRVAVVDFAIDDAQQSTIMGALFAINMRSFGDTHPEAAMLGWMDAAGLGDVQRRDLGPDRWLIVGTKRD
jgi:SAM-dependent methyltransferase